MKIVGSGEVLGAGCAAKAARLDEAASAGLPVPPAAVVLDGSELDQGRLEAVARRFDGPVAVRSAFGAEDGATSSLAGHFTSLLDIAPEPSALGQAIASVRASGAEHYRRDVLIMIMVAPERAGVAFTEPGWVDDLVNHTGGLADQLLTGTEAGEHLVLARQDRRRLTTPGTWSGRLAQLLYQVRKEFGDTGWDVEWADDGQTCWLLQLRPITAAPVRNERFTLANHREILPDPPSTFMTSLIVEAAPRLRGPLGLIDGGAGARRFIEVFDERPYLNLSMLSDRLRRLGLPTGLVAGSLGGADDERHGPAPTRILAAAPTLARLGLRQFSAGAEARAAADRFRRQAEAARPGVGMDAGSADDNGDEAAPLFAPAVESAATGYVTLVDQMASLAAAMAVPVAVLSRLGVLQDHIARQRTAGTRILDDLAPVVELVASQPELASALADGRPPADPEFERRWAAWLEHHGHRGSFESDLSRPRYREEPEPILSTVLALATASARRPGNDDIEPPTSPATPGDVARRRARGRRELLAEAKALLSRPLWWLAAGPMATREALRADAMRAFARYRADLLRASAGAVADGRLPTVDDLWYLTVDEVRLLDAGGRFSPDNMALRRHRWNEAAALDVADLRDRFGPLREAGADDSSTADPNRLRGLPLTTGRVRGRAWVLSEPSTQPPPGPGSVILVARSVEAGWVPTFSLVDAVAVEIGGDLSHGSIILRELGLPAVTNVGGLTAAVTTGDVIEVEADTGSVVIDPQVVGA